MPLNWSRALYYFADAVFSLFVIFPFTVAYWSGSWKILDLYTTPSGDQVFSSWLSLALGCFIGIIGYYIIPLLKNRIDPTCNVKHSVISRAFIYINAWGVIFFWRGVWNFVAKLLGDGMLTAGILLGVSYLLLMLAKSTSNVLGPPFAVQLDTTEHYYETRPRFRSQMFETPCLYSMDAIFTAVILQGIGVLVWVGMWNLFDAIILPHDLYTSYIISIVAGYASAVLLFLLQYPTFLIAEKLNQRGRIYGLLFEICINMAAFVAMLLLWRGCWGMTKDYVLTQRWAWDCWLCHGLGAAGLLLCQVGLVLGGVGCNVDGERGGGYDVVWPIDYFWLLCDGGVNTGNQGLNIQDDSENDPLIGSRDEGPKTGDHIRHEPPAATVYGSIPGSNNA